MGTVPRSVVEASLYNWLGYGNPNGTFWFVGFEESLDLGACANVETVEEYFERRSEFDVAMDLETVYEEILGRPLASFDRDTAWHKIARFLLAWNGEDPDLAAVQRCVVGDDARVGRATSETFCLETFPLIKASDSSIGRYGGIWESVDAYHEEVLERRIDLMVDTLRANENVEWVYVYGLSNPAADHLRDRFESSLIGTWDSGMNTRDPRVYELTVDPIGRFD